MATFGEQRIPRGTAASGVRVGVWVLHMALPIDPANNSPGID